MVTGLQRRIKLTLSISSWQEFFKMEILRRPLLYHKGNTSKLVYTRTDPSQRTSGGGGRILHFLRLS